MQWEEQESVLYRSSTFPDQGTTVRFIGSTRVQVTIAYNTRYNLSIIGTPCRQNTTEVIKLHYGEWFGIILSTPMQCFIQNFNFGGEYQSKGGGGEALDYNTLSSLV